MIPTFVRRPEQTFEWSILSESPARQIRLLGDGTVAARTNGGVPITVDPSDPNGARTDGDARLDLALEPDGRLRIPGGTIDPVFGGGDVDSAVATILNVTLVIDEPGQPTLSVFFETGDQFDQLGR